MPLDWVPGIIPQTEASSRHTTRCCGAQRYTITCGSVVCAACVRACSVGGQVGGLGLVGESVGRWVWMAKSAKLL